MQKARNFFRALYKALGNVLLSHGIPHTIIGDDAFHCPVRDGKEWDRFSIVTKHIRFNRRISLDFHIHKLNHYHSLA